MAVSQAFKQAMKRRTRRSRRWEVVFFFAVMALGLCGAGESFRLGGMWIFVMPYVYAVGRIYSWQVMNWDWQRRMIPVSSLDDRAMLEHGVVFDKLSEAQQKELLGRYRVGTYLMNFYPDEREEELRREAQRRAYEWMKVLLPVLAVVYWVGWRLLPEGRLRAGWTDGPVVLAWVLILVLALPQMILMWTEPDEVRESRVVTMEREA